MLPDSGNIEGVNDDAATSSTEEQTVSEETNVVKKFVTVTVESNETETVTEEKTSKTTHKVIFITAFVVVITILGLFVFFLGRLCKKNQKGPRIVVVDQGRAKDQTQK